jgi:transcriptional regulator with XRE-family HTH domain
MPTERLSMRHIREVLRLHYSVGMSQRAVARSLSLAQGTVSKYLNRTRRAGLTWPLPPELDDDVRLENRLYPPPSDLPSEERPQPDWAVVDRELRRPGVTLMLLWEEYCDTTSDGFSYSWFRERYKEWAGRLKLSLRQAARWAEVAEDSLLPISQLLRLRQARLAYGPRDLFPPFRFFDLTRTGHLHRSFPCSGSFRS